MTGHQISYEPAKMESGHGDSAFQLSSDSDTVPKKMFKSKNLAQVELLQPDSDTLAWIDGTAIQKKSDNPGHDIDGSPQDHAGFAWSLYHHTLELFSLLLIPTIARGFDPTHDKQGEKFFKRSLGRLFLWGGGFSDGKLESILDGSECLKETVLESLTAVGKILLFKVAPKRLLSPKWIDLQIRQEIHDLGILVEKARLITESDYESDDSSIDDVEEDLFCVITSLGVYVGCLMELLPSMEEILASLDWEGVDDKRQTQPIDFQISGPAQPYVLKVYDKFPLASLHLMHRLGEANWQRHMSLRAIGNENEEEKVVFPQEVPKITFVAISEFKDSGLGSSLPAQSAYAATVASHSSFQTTVDEKDSGNLRIPPTPKEVSEGETFQCQICGHFLRNIRNRVDWRRHVFADLKPYLCTFSGCKDEYKTFATRKLWEEHEFGQHRINRYWVCSTCQHKSGSPEEWRAHLVQAHNFPLSEGQYFLEARLVEVHESMPIESLSCPLCLELPGKSQRNFATHVGKHMEGIALAALPRDVDTTDMDSVASDISDASDTRLPDYFSEGRVDTQTLKESKHWPFIRASDNLLIQEYQENDTPWKASSKVSIEPAEHNPLSPRQAKYYSDPSLFSSSSEIMRRNVIEPLLSKDPLKCFYPRLEECVNRLDRNALCLRDLEKLLMSTTPEEESQSLSIILVFKMTALRAIQATVSLLPVSDRVRPHDRSYSSEYFREIFEELENMKGVGAQFQNNVLEPTRNARPEQVPMEGQKQARISEDSPQEHTSQISYNSETGGISGGLDEPFRVESNTKTSPVAIGLEIWPSSYIEAIDNATDEKHKKLSSDIPNEEDETMFRPPTRGRKRSSAPTVQPLMMCREPGCGKEFKRPCDLTKHEKLHDRIWKCPVESCKYHKLGWTTEKELDRHHEYQHDVARPMFECHFKPCPYISKRESNCKQHMEKAHGWKSERGKKKNRKSSIGKQDMASGSFADEAVADMESRPNIPATLPDPSPWVDPSPLAPPVYGKLPIFDRGSMPAGLHDRDLAQGRYQRYEGDRHKDGHTGTVADHERSQGGSSATASFSSLPSSLHALNKDQAPTSNITGNKSFAKSDIDPPGPILDDKQRQGWVGRFVADQWYCKCGREAKRIQVKVKGDDLGRWFYICPALAQEKQCNFHLWDNEQEEAKRCIEPNPMTPRKQAPKQHKIQIASGFSDLRR